MGARCSIGDARDCPDYDPPPPPSPPRYRTPDPFTVTGAVAAADDTDYLLEQHFWATALVGRDRLIELNTQAAAFFTDHYPQSWAPGPPSSTTSAASAPPTKSCSPPASPSAPAPER